MGRLQIARLLRELSITGETRRGQAQADGKSFHFFRSRKPRLFIFVRKTARLSARSAPSSVSSASALRAASMNRLDCHETDHIRVTDAQPINLRLAMSASCPVYP